MTHELDLKELRKVIEAGVTPGPWETVINCDDEDLPETVAVGSGEYLASGGANYRANDLILEVDTSSYEEGHELDEVLRRAKFIATFDPPTILALLTRLEQTEAAVARVREVLEHHTFVADDKYGDLAASQYYGDSELEAVAAKSITRALDGEPNE